MRGGTWVCVVFLSVLSLMPGEEMPRTGLPGHVEHFVAYAGTAFIATAGYGCDGRWLRVLGLLAVYAAALETLQNFSPGRHPAVADFLASVAGDVCGGLAIVGLRYINARSLRQRQAGDS
jgi:VanZ family protein